MLSFLGLVAKDSWLDLPNAAIGALYYTYLLILAPQLPPSLTKLATCLAFASTVFLAYQLTVVVFELCVLCWSSHVINTSLFYKLVIKSERVRVDYNKKRL
jgi:uncharacterized membrane protein